MGSIGAPEILVVLVVALIVLGPNRLPGAARSVGRAFREFRRITSGFQDELRGALEAEPEYSTASTVPNDTWLTTEEPASLTTPGTTTAPTQGEASGPQENGRPQPGGSEPSS